MSKQYITFPRVEGVASRQAHADLPAGTYEREISKEGFFGPASHLYHRHPPTGWTSFEGRSAADLRAAVLAGGTRHHGAFHAAGGQVAVFGRQLRKYSRDARAIVGGKVRRDGTGRDLGYPGGRHRPPRFDEEWTTRRTATMETGIGDGEQNRGR